MLHLLLKAKLVMIMNPPKALYINFVQLYFNSSKRYYQKTTTAIEK